MNRRKTVLLLACCLLTCAGLAQDVNLNGSTAVQAGIDGQFTNPVLSRMPAFLRFVWAVCGLTALVGGLRIYARVQTGTGDFGLESWRLMSAVIGVGIVALFLQGWVSKRMPGVTAARFGTDKLLYGGAEDNSEVTGPAPGAVTATPYLPGQDARVDSVRNYYKAASDSLSQYTR